MNIGENQDSRSDWENGKAFSSRGILNWQHIKNAGKVREFCESWKIGNHVVRTVIISFNISFSRSGILTLKCKITHCHHLCPRGFYVYSLKRHGRDVLINLANSTLFMKFFHLDGKNKFTYSEEVSKLGFSTLVRNGVQLLMFTNFI